LVREGGEEMYKCRIKIKGLAPLRMNRFDLENYMNPSGVKKNKEEVKKEAMKLAYYDEKVGYYIPAEALRKCFTLGAAKVKVKGLTKGLLEAVLAIEPCPFVPLIGELSGLHEAVVRIPPRTGGRVVKYWPFFENWEVSFNLVLLDDRILESVMKTCIQEAGMLLGLLDGRPVWGRFGIENFERIK